MGGVHLISAADSFLRFASSLAADALPVGRLRVDEVTEMGQKGKPGIIFLILGMAFIALGIGGQRAFLVAGLAFLAVGLVTAIRQRRGGGS